MGQGGGIGVRGSGVRLDMCCMVLRAHMVRLAHDSTLMALASSLHALPHGQQP